MMSWLDWFKTSTAILEPESSPATAQRLVSEPRAGTGLIAAQPVDLASLLCTALRPLIMQAATREVRLIVAPAPDFPETVTVDGLKLAWATTALVGSALRYTRKGGVMTAGGSISVKIGWEPATRTAVIQVADNGRGIPPEEFSSLLERRTVGRVPSFQLLLIEDIVHAHGGSLELSSIHDSLQGGTTASLRIPCP